MASHDVVRRAALIHESSSSGAIHPRTRGLKQVVTTTKMSAMKRELKFKEMQRFGWEHEPNERPTDFAHSTQWTSEWTPFPGEDAGAASRFGLPRRVAKPQVRLGFLLGSFASVGAVAFVGMLVLMRWLHA